MLGYAYARANDRARARECRQWLDREARQHFVPGELLALVDVGLGDRGRALDDLEQAYRNRSSGMVYLAAEPALDSLRSDPRFIRLQRAVAAGGPPLPAPTPPSASSH